MLSASGQLDTHFGVDAQALLVEGVERLVTGAMARRPTPAAASPRDG
jgi:hypothetical protein